MAATEAPPLLLLPALRRTLQEPPPLFSSPPLASIPEAGRETKEKKRRKGEEEEGGGGEGEEQEGAAGKKKRRSGKRAKKEREASLGEASPSTPPKWSSAAGEVTTTKQQQQRGAAGNEGGAAAAAAAGATEAAGAGANDSAPVPPPPLLPHSSTFRGVSCHKATGRWEASIWLGRRQAYLGKAVFGGFNFFRIFFRKWEKVDEKIKKTFFKIKTGGFEIESDAARAYDVAALACRGPKRALTNFPPEEYLEEIAALAEAAGIPLSGSTSTSTSAAASAAANPGSSSPASPLPPPPPPPPPLSVETLPLLPHDLVVAHVRRRSTAFARGKSPFRGVSGEEGRWEARIGALFGRKNVRETSFFFEFFFPSKSGFFSISNFNYLSSRPP